MIVQSPINKCLVSIEKKYQYKDGVISIDTSWRPEEFATLEGVVVSAPAKIEHDENRDVVGSVKQGDKVIFSYGVVYNYEDQPDNDTPIYRNLLMVDDKEYWKVDLGDMFCKVDGEKITMVTNHLLLSMFHVENKAVEHLGIVKGLPENINLSVRVGDTVCFEPRFVQKYNILGQEHFILPSRRVLAKL